MRFQSKLILASSLAIAILTGLGILSFRKVSENQKDQQWVGHTRLVIEALDDLQLRMITAERGPESRGAQFSSGHLGSAPAGEQIRSSIQSLRELTADNQRQQQALDRLAPAIEISLQTADGDLSGSPESTSARVRAQAQVQAIVADMKREERRLLTERLRVAAQSARRAKIFIALGNGIALGFLVLAIFSVQHEMRKQAEALEALGQSEERFRLMGISGKRLRHPDA